MSSGYSNRAWQCPFFRWDERRKVHCEGGSAISMPDAASFRAYISRHCSSHQGWHSCSIAVQLSSYWDRVDRAVDNQRDTNTQGQKNPRSR